MVTGLVLLSMIGHWFHGETGSMVLLSDLLTKPLMAEGQWETVITICVIYDQRFRHWIFKVFLRMCLNYVLIFTICRLAFRFMPKSAI